jgi:4-hydroxy-3-methylbut-2-enyl diphosphate reductase
VVIVGDRRHAEIKGIIGRLSRPAVVIDSLEELHEAAASHVLKRKVGVVFQTTHSLELCRHIVGELVFLCKEVQIVNTICRPVQSRQYAAAELAKRVDLMLVVGSSTSANTIEMAALCRVHNPWTRHIETAGDLRDEDLAWATYIGIASGLSTPVECVEEVRAAVLAYPKPPVGSLRPDPSVYDQEAHGPR